MSDDTVTKPDSNSEPAAPTTSSKSSSIKPPHKKTNNHRYYAPVAAKATSTKANRVILLGVGGAVGIILIARASGTPGTKSLTGPGDLLKIGIGGSATIIGLMVMAEISPDVAIAFAWLILIGAFLSYGVDFATAITKGTTNPGAPAGKLGGKAADPKLGGKADS